MLSSLLKEEAAPQFFKRAGPLPCLLERSQAFVGERRQVKAVLLSKGIPVEYCRVPQNILTIKVATWLRPSEFRVWGAG